MWTVRCSLDCPVQCVNIYCPPSKSSRNARFCEIGRDYTCMQKCKSDLAQRVGAAPGGHTSCTHASSRDTASTHETTHNEGRSTAHQPRRAVPLASVRHREGGLPFGKRLETSTRHPSMASRAPMLPHDVALSQKRPSALRGTHRPPCSQCGRGSPRRCRTRAEQAMHPETLKNLLAEMSLKLVPNIVAKNTTTETPDAKKLVVLPYSVSSPRLCAHTNTMQAMGLSERGRDKLARGLSTCIAKSHLPSRTRGRQMVEYEEDAVQLAGTPKRGCLGKYSLSCLIVGVDDLADARAPCKVRSGVRARTQRSGCERTRAISEQAQF